MRSGASLTAPYSRTRDGSRPHVYEHLEWLSRELNYPVYRTAITPSLKERVSSRASHSGGVGYIDIPVYLKGATRAENGIGARHCTENYKIVPIRRKIRELLGLGRRSRVSAQVEQWLGISRDEAGRMKDSRVRFITNRYPLIEAGMSRADCKRWWSERYERPVAKSACIACPYQPQSRWLETKARYPEIFAELVEIDANLRDSGLMYLKEPYLHSSRLPLDQAVDLTAAQGRFEVDGFGNECEGHCGV